MYKILDDHEKEPDSRFIHLILASSSLTFGQSNFIDLASKTSNILLDFARITTPSPDLPGSPIPYKRQKNEEKIKIGFVTGLKRETIKSITKARCIEMQRLYRTGREKDPETGWVIKKCFGDELAIFYDRMKNKVQFPVFQGLKDAFTESGIASFQLKMLSDSDDEKFELSICHRKTSIIYNTTNRSQIFHMKESDKRVSRNYCPKIVYKVGLGKPLAELSQNTLHK